MLSIAEGGIYTDATVGLGGHTEEILKKVGTHGRVIGIDRDEEALRMTAERLNDSRLVLKKGRFSDIEKILGAEGIEAADGILLDLGVSMMQLKDLTRGFSFHSAERLDMRMDSAAEFSAWDVVNEYSERDLIRILKEYGEEYLAVRIVRAIANYRAEKNIDTCAELADIVSRAIGRRGKVHPATKTFQALRIVVNDELDSLASALPQAVSGLRPGGRLAVISFHSLEDRIIKNYFRDQSKALINPPYERIYETERKAILKEINRKPIVPSQEEIHSNPRARSAKLRVVEKL